MLPPDEDADKKAPVRRPEGQVLDAITGTRESSNLFIFNNFGEHVNGGPGRPQDGRATFPA